METENETFVVMPDPAKLCRLCANTHDQLIPIFKEGIDLNISNISNKIEKHLPIVKISEEDKLPLQICYQCASTLIAWHNFYEGCGIADTRLRKILCVDEKISQDDSFDDCLDELQVDYDDEESQNNLIENVRLTSASSSSQADDVRHVDNTAVNELSETKIYEETENDNHSDESKSACSKYSKADQRKSHIKYLNDQLLESVKNGDLDQVQKLMKQLIEVNVNVTGKKYDSSLFTVLTPLTLAVKEGHIEIVEMLVQTSKININKEVDENGRTLLHLASELGHAELVKAILKTAGIAVNKKDKLKQTALYKAASAGKTETVKVLLSNPKISVSVNGNSTSESIPLHSAIYFHHLEVVRALLNYPDINVNVKDEYGRTSLHVAASQGDLIMVEMLLEAGININGKTNEGCTAYDLAVKNYHNDVIKMIDIYMKSDESFKKNTGTSFLLEAVLTHDINSVTNLLKLPHIRVNSKDQDKNTALHLAAMKGHVKIVELLLAMTGIDVNAEDSECGHTPLHLASWAGYTEIIELILKTEGVLINKRDKYGQTPLHYAIGADKTETVTILLKASGICVNEKDGLSNSTPLHLAVDFNRSEIIKALLYHPGINKNVRDMYGQTALHIAAFHGDLITVNCLLEIGVNINEKTNEGYTAIEWARKQQHSEVVETIENHVKRAEMFGVLPHININVQLLEAVRMGDIKMTEKLLKLPDIRVNSTDLANYTPLHLAARQGNVEIVKMLLAMKEINVNAVCLVLIGKDSAQTNSESAKSTFILIDTEGYVEVLKSMENQLNISTNVGNKYCIHPLHLAVKQCYPEVVKVLLCHPDINVNASVATRCYFNSLHMAIQKNDVMIVKMLIDHPKIDLSGIHFRTTPLYMAVKANNLEIVKTLLSHKNINVNIKDEYGRTPFDLAKQEGYAEIAKVLKNHVRHPWIKFLSEIID